VADPPAEEEVLWEGTYSAKSLLGGWLLAAVVVGVVAAIALSQMPWYRGLMVSLLVAALCLGSLGLYAMYRKLSVHYRLTSQRFLHEEGLLRRVTHRIEMIDVDDVACAQRLLDRIMGVGTVKIISSDRSHPELFLEGVAGVQHVAMLIDNARRAERQRRGLFIESV
jgi:membrane protein YdbS with pleckstrin-like domain